MDVKVTDFTVDGRCSSCGKCCSGTLPMSRADVDRIKDFMQKHPLKEQRHNGMQGTDFSCPFRDETNKKCLIYEVRPAICKQFMCNHTIDDLQAAKAFFHDHYKVVFMRSEFFGNYEVEQFLENHTMAMLREASRLSLRQR